MVMQFVLKNKAYVINCIISMGIYGHWTWCPHLICLYVAYRACKGWTSPIFLGVFRRRHATIPHEVGLPCCGDGQLLSNY